MAHRPTIIRPSHQTPRKTPPTSKAMLALGMAIKASRPTPSRSQGGRIAVPRTPPPSVGSSRMRRSPSSRKGTTVRTQRTISSRTPRLNDPRFSSTPADGAANGARAASRCCWLGVSARGNGETTLRPARSTRRGCPSVLFSVTVVGPTVTSALPVTPAASQLTVACKPWRTLVVNCAWSPVLRVVTWKSRLLVTSAAAPAEMKADRKRTDRCMTSASWVGVGAPRAERCDLGGGHDRLVAVSKGLPLAERISVLGDVGGRFRPALHLELSEDGRDMVLDGFLGDVDVASDLRIGLALGQQGEDLAFPTGQPGDLSVPSQNRALPDPGKNLAGDGRIEQTFPLADTPHGADQLGRRRRFQHVSGRSGHDRGEQGIIVRVGREHQDIAGGDARLDLPGRLDATAAGEPDVHHHHVGLRSNGIGNRIWSGARFGHDPVVTLGIAARSMTC